MQDESFLDLFRAAQHEAFHLEVEDSYYTSDYEPLKKFLAGEPQDFGWFQPWLIHIRETTGRGVSVNRARVVSVPHNDYTRYAMHVAELNREAGEDIRYLPRHLVESGGLTTDDWWMFDDRVVAFTVFEPVTNRWMGAAVTTDPHIVEYVHAVKTMVWSMAIPLSEYSER
ncbi:hypothetical protein JK358_22165 [Nocardia sp. 2]|uniref:DUF6879 domain-containing protein n=1 Tax=Nocardia acididurans TaxID=2802282 RepID=A0ABS1MD45_9NOCA|nr:DUF6879 family protein [Nocardia acididurans]MBL1077108.1 hypothetical protein [Nocardia acididurans]